MKKLLYIIIVILVYGCHDSYANLGDSYIYESGRIDRIINEETGTLNILIPDQVLNYEYDDNYIIAYQVPDSAIIYEFDIDSYRRDTTSQSQEKADSMEALLDKMLIIRDCYWIIRKADCKRYGPMTETDFYRECRKMKITIMMDKKYEQPFLKSKE